jgi:hypothetical protein
MAAASREEVGLRTRRKCRQYILPLVGIFAEPDHVTICQITTDRFHGRPARLTAEPEVKRDIHGVAHAMEAGTLVMSAVLNALAFTGGRFDAGR